MASAEKSQAVGSIEGTHANTRVEVRSSVRFDELCREVIIEDKKGPIHVVFTCMEDAWNHVYHTSVHAATKGQQRAGSDRHCFARLGPVRGPPFGVNQKAKGAQG